MLVDSYICQRCQSEIIVTDEILSLNICPYCSWDRFNNDLTYEKNIAKISVRWSAALFAVFVVAIMQSASWGQFSIRVLPLQVKSLLGMSNEADLQQMADMCKTINDAVCVEKMLTKKAQINPGQISNLAELGLVQFDREKYLEARKSLEEYVSRGGTDLHAHFALAQTLANIGEVEAATTEYERILAIKPNTIQVTVTQAYFDMLVKNGKQKQAVALIRGIQKKGSNTSDFMEVQLRKLASEN